MSGWMNATVPSVDWVSPHDSRKWASGMNHWQSRRVSFS